MNPTSSIRCLNLDVAMSTSREMNMSMSMDIRTTTIASQEHARINQNIPRTDRCFDLNALCLAELHHSQCQNTASPAIFPRSLSSWSEHHINGLTSASCSTPSSSCSTPIYSAYGRQRSTNSLDDSGKYEYAPCPTPAFCEEDIEAQMRELGYAQIEQETYERPAKRMCLNTKG